MKKNKTCNKYAFLLPIPDFRNNIASKSWGNNFLLELELLFNDNILSNIGMGRNTLGSNIKYLKYLTDKFIIIPDNDEAGMKGYKKIKEVMDRYGLILKRISISNPKLKDVADVYTGGNWFF